MDVGENSTIDFADLDGDGDMDAWVGADSGNFTYFRNDGNAESPGLTAIVDSSSPFYGISVDSFGSATFVDIDIDGNTDADADADADQGIFFDRRYKGLI